MNLKQYKINHTWIDLSVTLEVDHDKLTPEVAHLINEFWSGADERIDDTNDEVMAVIKYAGSCMMGYILETNYTAEYIQKMFDREEGWGGEEFNGIKLISYDGVPDLCFYNLEIEAVA